MAESLRTQNHVYFEVDKRGFYDSHNILVKNLRRKNRDEEKGIGIDTDLTDLKRALEDLIEIEDAAESKQRAADDQKKQDKENASEMRNRAMKTFGQSTKVTYLREKNKRMEKIKKEELDIKRLQLEKEVNFF